MESIDNMLPGIVTFWRFWIIFLREGDSTSYEICKLLSLMTILLIIFIIIPLRF